MRGHVPPPASIIQQQVEFGFRKAPAKDREELVQKTLAQAFGLYVKLCHRGRNNLAFATPLAKFAVRRVAAPAGG